MKHVCTCLVDILKSNWPAWSVVMPKRCGETVLVNNAGACYPSVPIWTCCVSSAQATSHKLNNCDSPCTEPVNRCTKLGRGSHLPDQLTVIVAGLIPGPALS